MMPEEEESRALWKMHAEWGDFIFDTLERMTILAAIYAAAEISKWPPLTGLYYAGMFALIMAANGTISLMLFKEPSQIPPLPEPDTEFQATRNFGARLPRFLIVVTIFGLIAFGIPATVERLVQSAT